MMMSVLEFALHEVKQEPGSGGINPAIGITNFVGCITGTFFMHDANNNDRDASAVQLYGNNILARVRDMGRRV